MSVSPFIAALLMGGQAAPEQPIGRLSEVKFLDLLAQMRCKVHEGPDGSRLLMRNGTSAFFYTTVDDDVYSNGISTGKYVKNLSVQVEFVLPRMLEREKLDQLALKQKDFAFVESYLDGKVSMYGSLWSAFESRDRLRKSISRFFDGVRTLATALKPLGGKQAYELYRLGGAPLDLSIKLDRVEQEDMVFLVFKLGWRDQFEGGSGSYWQVPAHPHGEEVVLERLPDDQMKRWGFPEKRKGFVITALRSTLDNDPDRWMREVGWSIGWSKVRTLDKKLQFCTFVDTTDGLSLAEISKRMGDFAQKIKALKLEAVGLSELCDSTVR